MLEEGHVYSARDTKTGARVGLEFFGSRGDRNPPRLQRRVGGAKAASALNYPHIITIYEVVRSDDEAAIAMELADGEARIRLLTLTGREPGITEKTVTLAGLHYLNGVVWAADGRGW